MLPLYALLRSPRDRWRRRDAVPSLGCRGHRTTLPSVFGGLMADSVQVAVLGAGPGGYAAAFYAADLGMQVALINGEEPGRRVPLSRVHSVKGASARRKGDRRSQARGQLGRQLRRALNRRGQTSFLQAGRCRQADGSVGSVAKLRKVKFIQGRATLTSPTSLKVSGAGGAGDRTAVRASDSRNRVISDAHPVALDRERPRDGLHRRPQPGRRSRSRYS